MTYTKHKVVRCKDLNRTYFELVLSREDLKFSPGNSVEFFNNGTRAYIATGISYPQFQFVLEKSEHEDLYHPDYLFTKPTVKINRVIDSFPNLYKDTNPAFIVSGEGINIALSYVSTYPDRKVEIVYLDDDPVLLDWLRAKQFLKQVAEDLDKSKTYYVAGQRAKLQTFSLMPGYKLEFNDKG